MSDDHLTMSMDGMHFTGGDILLFRSLAPSSAGAVAGAAIVLFVLALFERWLSATRLVLDARWHRSAMSLAAERVDKLYYMEYTRSADDAACHTDSSTTPPGLELPKDSGVAASPNSHALRPPRTIAPFIFSYDVPRGALHALQTLITYVLMLAIMTFQAAYLISIVAGAGVGEFLFGRYRMFATTQGHVH